MMNQNLQVLTQKLATKLNIDSGNGLVETLKATVFKGPVTEDQMIALMVVANQYCLNPWTKEIYAFPDKNNGIVPVVGVDGWARIINTHSQFDGMEFEQDSESCTCIIYRKDRSHPISVTEYLSECSRPAKNGYSGPWQSHPKRMLRHKAMIQCARLAFGYTGIFDQDEAERILDAQSARPMSARNPANIIVGEESDSYREYENKYLPIVRQAAQNGQQALSEVFETLPKEHKKKFWQLHQEELKRLASESTIIDVEAKDAD